MTISRKDFLKHSVLGSAALGTPSVLTDLISQSGSRNEKPNIVLFLTDDHAWWDAGCYGNDIIRTPNLDHLAEQGMRFDNAYTVTTTCSPSRSSIYTGMGPHRHGAHENHSAITTDLPTLPRLFNDLGYRTILAGKTHIRPKDKFPFEYIDTEGDWNTVIVKEGSEVLQFLSEEAEQSEPFCLVIATNNPHVPWPLEAEYDPSNVNLHPFHLNTPETRKAMANYYTDVTKVDRELGRLMLALDRNDLTDHTALIYTSDHGPQFPHGKWELYDYGMKIPLVIRWPGYVAPGSTNSAMLQTTDLLPTILEIAGADASQHMDGRSFRSELTNPSGKHRSQVFATHTRDLNMNYFPIRAVRREKYKYIRNLHPERPYTSHITNSNNFKENGGAGMYNSWLEKAKTDPKARKRIKQYQQRPAEELYDLEKDPHELTNIADMSSMGSVKENLRKELRSWMKNQGDPGLDVLE